MENSIRINSNKLQLREYNGQRVVTFKDIDTVHERKDGTAKRNFYTNRERFIEGVDYFRVCEYEIRTSKLVDISPKTHSDTLLLSESGYLMLAKSFTDDLAWKVQRELVNNYFRGKAPEPEQLTLETSEYHYFPKTLNGVPVITLEDFEHFTGVPRFASRRLVKKICTLGEEWHFLAGTELFHYKAENAQAKRATSTVIVLKAAAVRKLLDYLKLSTKIPMIEEKQQQPIAKPQAKRTANEILDEHRVTHNDCIIALDVLRRIERNCENNVKMAEREGRSTKLYNQGLSEIKNVIKGVGMLLVMGY